MIGVCLTSCSTTPDTPGAGAARQERRLGQDLFVGKADLSGRIRTHSANLPPEVVRCANCHALPQGPAVAGSLAPRLTPPVLLENSRRHGGPPSAYDFSSFCTLLRKGHDPGYVVMSIEMPLYQVDDMQCHALWEFLTGGSGEAAQH